MLTVPHTGAVGEAFAAIVGLCGTIAAVWLAVVGLRRMSESLPDEAEHVARHYWKIAYPAVLAGGVAGLSLASFAESRLAIAGESMSGFGIWFAGALIGVAPGMTIAAFGGRTYQRALDAHYEGTRWARPPKR